MWDNGIFVNISLKHDKNIDKGKLIWFCGVNSYYGDGSVSQNP